MKAKLKKKQKYNYKQLSLFAVLFAVIGTTVIMMSQAASPQPASQPVGTKDSQFGYKATPSTPLPPITTATVSPAGAWTWPATLENTGPAAGTVFTSMPQRDFTAADNGKTFDGIQINATNPRGIYVTASDITFKNCKIVYTGTATSENGFLFLGNPSDKSVRPKNITFDHCIIDDGNRFEYNVRAYYAQYNIQYSQVRGGSHNIDSGGSLDAGSVISLLRNYIYDYDDKPFHSATRYEGHAANIYFTGNNGTVNIEENTIIGNRYEACTAGGFSNGPGPGCRDNSSLPAFNGTGSVVVYADEDSNPDKSYVIKHNQISGSSYYPMRFYGGAPGIQSIQIVDNVYTAQSKYPKFSIEGSIYAFDAGAKNRTISGNMWGTDTECYKNPNSCPGKPNSAQ